MEYGIFYMIYGFWDVDHVTDYILHILIIVLVINLTHALQNAAPPLGAASTSSLHSPNSSPSSVNNSDSCDVDSTRTTESVDDRTDF